MTTMHDELVTTGQLAIELGQPQHRVLYILASRRIQPQQRAGRFRMFSRKTTIRTLRAEFTALEAARRARAVPA